MNHRLSYGTHFVWLIQYDSYRMSHKCTISFVINNSTIFVISYSTKTSKINLRKLDWFKVWINTVRILTGVEFSILKTEIWWKCNWQSVHSANYHLNIPLWVNLYVQVVNQLTWVNIIFCVFFMFHICRFFPWNGRRIRNKNVGSTFKATNIDFCDTTTVFMLCTALQCGLLGLVS